MSRSFLEAHGLVKGYQSGGSYLPVLQDTDLDVAEGEMIAILGASGVGKSTLLHVLGTLDEPEKGHLWIGTEDVFTLAEPDRTRLRNRTIGFIFQFHHLLPEFTAVENVMMPLLIARTPPADAKVRARKLLELLGLAGRELHRPAQLSGGEQQRVAVARALVREPRLVLADEPTGNLDRNNSDEIIELLRQFHRKRGLTSILVTHNEKIASICDRVFTMEEGRLIEGTK
ncbi:ABC transporter ATP-binding protein [Desulfosarcina sp.]|nr:ABC transporter ATP-binding protein [Desulfosarcina sp.]